MNIITPYAHITPHFDAVHGLAMLQQIERIARVSHRSEDKQTFDSWRRFIKSVVIDKGDWSVTEHCNITVEAVVDRGIQQEWTRHRIGAYTVESTRFVNYEKVEVSFILPQFDLTKNSDADIVWENSVKAAEENYLELLRGGSAPQLARSVLPLSLASKMYATYNLRMWRHFFLMRTTKEAHPQMKQVIVPLLNEFKSKIPLLYDDITAESRQTDNMQKAH